MPSRARTAVERREKGLLCDPEYKLLLILGRSEKRRENILSTRKEKALPPTRRSGQIPVDIIGATRRFAQEGKKYIKLSEANRGSRLNLVF